MPPRLKRPLHLLLRIPAKREKISAIVGAHEQVIKDHGAVWVALRGGRLSSDRLRAFKDQSRAGVRTFFYLVQREGLGFALYRGTLVDVDVQLPGSERHMIPRYYADVNLTDDAGVWVKVAGFDRMPKTELDALHVGTTGTPVKSVLSRSLASQLVITRTRNNS